MDKTIEIYIESAGGTIDCMLEPQRSDTDFFYSTTILYPEMANGYGRSEIFYADIRPSVDGNRYEFDNTEELHPKILKLEREISDAILAAI